MASFQLYRPERGTNGELELIGHRGFSEEIAMFAKWISNDFPTPCGLALKNRERVTNPDIQNCEFIVSGITRNKIILNKERVELNNLLCHCVEDHLAMFQEKNVELSFRPASSEVYVEADPSRLSQLVGNLLRNAVKFTESGGFVILSITVYDLRQIATISVTDKG